MARHVDQHAGLWWLRTQRYGQLLRRVRHVGDGPRHGLQGLRPERRFAALSGEGLYHLRSQRAGQGRSEEHTSELQSLMRISYAVFCLKKKTHDTNTHIT